MNTRVNVNVNFNTAYRGAVAFGSTPRVPVGGRSWHAGGDTYSVSSHAIPGGRQYALQSQSDPTRRLSFDVGNRGGRIGNVRSNNMPYADRNELIGKARGEVFARHAGNPLRRFGEAGFRQRLDALRANCAALRGDIQRCYPSPSGEPAATPADDSRCTAWDQQVAALKQEVAALNERLQSRPETKDSATPAPQFQQQLAALQQQLAVLEKAVQTLIANAARAPGNTSATPADGQQPTGTASTPASTPPTPVDTNPQATPQPTEPTTQPSTNTPDPSTVTPQPNPAVAPTQATG